MTSEKPEKPITVECVCPQCGALLRDIKQKLVCPRCGVVEGCCEGGRQ